MDEENLELAPSFSDDLDAPENPFGKALEAMYHANIHDTFYDNFCDEIPDDLLMTLGRKLKDLYQDDLDANAERLEIIKSGIEALGLSKASDRDGDSFLNSSFLDAWLGLCAVSSTELFSPNNIVQVSPILDYQKKFSKAQHNAAQAQAQAQQQQQMQQQTPMQPQDPNQPPQGQMQAQPPQPPENTSMEIYQIAAAAEDDLNFMLCEKYPDMIEEMENAIAQSFIAGSCVVKIYFDPTLNRPYIKMIPPDKINADPEATNLSAADRISHSYTLSERELRDYVHSGFFSRKHLPNFNPSFELDDDNNLDQTREDITGVVKNNTDFQSPLNNVYTFVETEIALSLSEVADKGTGSDAKSRLNHRLLPYAVTFELETAKVVRVVRKWNQKAKDIRKIPNLVQFKFLPGFGIWGLGLAHLAVSLAHTATLIEKELVKSARLANFPGGIMRSDAQVDKSVIELNAATYTKVRTSDALGEVFKEMPFTPPSPMMKEILSDIENKIQKISATTSIKLDNMPANIKSSVLLAVIEKEMTPQSAVLRRIQASINQALKIIQRILINEMGDEEFGDHYDLVLPEYRQEMHYYTNREIYGKPLIVRSAADPTLTSSAAQLVRAQYMHEVAQSDPTMHKMNEVYRRLYQIMRIPDIDGILMTPEEVQQMQQQQAEQAAKQIDQGQILMEDVKQKAEAANKKAQIDMAKIQAKSEYDAQKLEIERMAKQQQFEYEQLKEQLKHLDNEREHARMDEQTYIDNLKKINDIIIEKYKTEFEIGREIPTEHM